MTDRLVLDEHHSAEIARRLRQQGHDVVAVVEHAQLRAKADADLFAWAAAEGRRIVTENVQDFQPLLAAAYASKSDRAPLLLVSPRRFPRGTGTGTEQIVRAISEWLGGGTDGRTDEDWLT